ncbi:MAG: nucleotidyltransferase family protein [Gallionellaceae bacterium]|nr:nucleotidyltransferase family protein [Gallionellaceae bacterium]
MNTENQLWRETLVPQGATIQQAIYSLDKSAMQIVLIVAENGQLLGTVTDGDIRRAFLRGLRLDSNIDDVIHRNPLVAPPEITRDLILHLMQANKIHQVPIVDSEGKVIGLHIWDSMIAPEPLDNLMVIMAGGKGTRLRPHTENCPKPLLEVGGKPMLEHIIERARADGFHNFLVSLHYLGEMIEEYFGDGRKLGVTINYLKEDTPLGTAGCLSLMPTRPETPFLVTNGDVLTDIHYNEILDFHVRQNAMATMAVRPHEIQNQFGVVRIKGVEIENFEEKPIYRSHINAGIYVLNPEALNQLEHEQHCDMPTLFERIKRSGGRTIVYPMHEPWLDVGQPYDLAEARKTKN